MTSKKSWGYSKELMIMPFDHRGSFQSKMFGIHGKPTPDETKLIASYKTMIYEGFEKAASSGLPKEKMGILVDEQFGEETLARARKAGFITCIPAEKSGQDEFDFEYGDKFREHIEKFSPDFVKVLVRYNPESEGDLNRRQSSKLKVLSEYLHTSGRKFMFELLVPATDAQLEKCKGDKSVYDVEMRPRLMVEAIEELLKAGVEADVWKLEGLDRQSDFEKVTATAKAGGREAVGCIVLGRGENDQKVRDWLSVGARVQGVIGFAVGRTIFWEPLKEFKEGKVTREQSVAMMADKYGSFCKLWVEARTAAKRP